jgi:glycosyltransferase involved in cell wall biosynthesis
MHSVDLIIPARNEADNIPALFDALSRQAFRNVIVADNASTDRTRELAAQRGAVVVSEPTPGYGAACLAALRRIAEDGQGPPEAVAFLDADLSDDPARLPPLIERVTRGEADLAVGARTRLAEPGALEPHQRFGNALACRLIAWFTGHRFSDLGPLRVIRWHALERLDMQDRTWGWIVEMNFKAVTRGLAIAEIDVPYRKRHAGASKISGSIKGSCKAGIKIIATILQLHRSERSRRLPP